MHAHSHTLGSTGFCFELLRFTFAILRVPVGLLSKSLAGTEYPSYGKAQGGTRSQDGVNGFQSWHNKP